nr:nucleotide-binding alpha-beta plait domain-containing protein [Tanacetum cinerariifolium]
MGNYRTKEDDVASISTSVYITNFPKSNSAKELFKVCRQYGHVVDSFIPNKKSKTGKRPMGKKEENGGKKPFVVPVISDQAKKNDKKGTIKSYRGALNGDNNKETIDKWGKLLDVDDQDDSCFHSKRLCVHMKSCKSIQEEFKIIHHGRVYWIQANETPGWVPDDTEDDETNSLNEGDLEQKPAEFEENSDEEIVPDTIFEGDDVEKRVADEKKEEKEIENSKDPI